MSKVALFIQAVVEKRMSEATAQSGSANPHVSIQSFIVVAIKLTL
jgi:hypothetical protein